MSKKPILLTRYIYENGWTPITKEEALRLITEAMHETDPEGTLTYILSATKEGKTVTLGETLFKALADDYTLFRE